MRVLLWNVNGGKPPALDWLEQQEWDVALLLEVKRPCLRRLREGPWHLEDTSDDAKRSGHQLAVAVLCRPGTEVVGRVPPPEFRAMGGRYLHRVLAVELRDESGEPWTVLGAHMPNSRFPSGKDHGPKDECFRELRYWMATRPAEERLVIGMDANPERLAAQREQDQASLDRGADLPPPA